jgi:UDP-N-acetylglucosamine diphosphorylase/glucosamine-1-phosphate N-acetyltransferase
VAEIRFGILTLAETWLRFLKDDTNRTKTGYLTESYLSEKYSTFKIDSDTLILAGNCKPTQQLVDEVLNLTNNEILIVNDKWVAKRGVEPYKEVQSKVDEVLFIEEPWHIFQNNGKAIEIDFKLLTENRTSEKLSATNQHFGKHPIFIEKGVKVECAILNTNDGPIYIGQDAEVMEGSIIRGPFALGEHAVVKMGAKIYGPTTIGPYCKVGGEISNCVFFAYSNKGHDGFLGNSVVGEWCNFGADSNSSNLKNNYSNVRVYSYETKQLEEADILFCGVLMGDHSKTGINTMLNTATVVGVSANIFGADFPPKYIPSFSWGGANKIVPFDFEKAMIVARNMMGRRKIELSNADVEILRKLSSDLAQ